MPNSSLWRFSYMFSFKSFMDLYFTFISVIQFEFIWINFNSLRFNFFLFWVTNCSNTIYWKVHCLSIEFPLNFCQKSMDNIGHICVVLFLYSVFYSTDLCMSPFTKTICCNYMVNFKTRSMNPSTLFLFQNFLDL